MYAITAARHDGHRISHLKYGHQILIRWVRDFLQDLGDFVDDEALPLQLGAHLNGDRAKQRQRIKT